jgi:hypothetical protein
MWQCSKCGNSVEDNFDTCWSCGTSPDGVEDLAFTPENGANDEPVVQGESLLTGVQTPSEVTTGSKTTESQSDPGWSEAGLAALLLRLLGVYFTACAIIYGAEEAVRLLLASRELGLDFVLPKHWTYLTYLVAELTVGLYLLFGGRWVYEKVLTPIAQNPMKNPSDGTDEDRSCSVQDDKPANNKAE